MEQQVWQYSDFLASLTVLEEYADVYAREHSGEDATALVINYIRTGVEKYTSGAWTAFCGPENTNFSGYVAEQDTANSTTAGSLRSLNEFKLPNGDAVDFAHMFGAMDMAYTLATRVPLTSAAGPVISVTCSSLRPMPV